MTLALILGLPVAAAAHDPGLSSLEVRVTSRHLVADLSLAAADADAAKELDPDADVGSFALRAIELRIEERRLLGTVEAIAIETSKAVRVRLTYARTPGSRLAVSSLVPSRLARGHRELLSIRREDGSLLAERMLDAGANEGVADLNVATSRAEAAIRFFTLGVGHILSGYDHVLFLAGLLLVVRGRGEAAKIVTAFTAGHSLTLALAVLGLARVPAGIVEPAIAASIAYVGFENLVRPHASSRWRLTFGFGLIHGFGFAGALRDLGIGSDGAAIAAPLSSFNLGVEAGQIAVAMVMLPLIWRLKERPELSARLIPICSLLVAVAGGYWLVERTIG